MRRTLVGMKRNPGIKEKFKGKKVRIWSGQWRQWWRPGANGYSPLAEEAGIYEFDDAWDKSAHCGPEKKISYQIVNGKDGKDA